MHGSDFERAKAHFTDGLALLEAGDAAGAAACFGQSLALLPGRVSTLVNLAAAQVRLQQPQAVLATVAQILAAEPGNAEAVLHRAAALAQLGRRSEALADYDRVLALHPALADAHLHRGNLLRELGRAADAAAAFDRAAALGGDPALTAFYRAAVVGGDAPPTAPADYVQGLFDGYAGDFEAHLVGQLGYRVPALLDGLLPMGARYARALDAGCGTGLAGAALRARCGHLAGVDLSAAMLERARERGVYDVLVQADAADHLLAQPAASLELLVSADVFIYVGALERSFAAAAHALVPGGAFAFSVERAAVGGYELRPSLRYAHGDAYVRDLAAAHGFGVRTALQADLRADDAGPVAGLLYLLVRDGP